MRITPKHFCALGIFLTGVALDAHCVRASEKGFPGPEELGLSTHVVSLSGGRHKLEVRDLENGERTDTTYSYDGSIEKIEDFTAGGALSVRLTMKKNGVLREEFIPRYTWQMLTKTGPEEVKLHEDNGVEREFQLERVLGDQGYPGNRPLCLWDLKEPEDAELDKLLADTSWLKKTDTACPDGFENIGSNICAEKLCDHYPRGTTGMEGLKKDLLGGLSKGMKCLKQYTKHRGALRSLVGILSNGLAKPVTIKCAALINENYKLERNTMAIAESCGSKDYPGMFVNMAGSSFYKTIMDDPLPTFNDPPGVLFHEVMHWMNNLHGEGYDLPYITQACCFADGTNNDSGINEYQVKTHACDMLQNIYAKDWYKPEYQQAFASISVQGGFPEQSVWSAWQGTYAPRSQRFPEKRDYTGLMQAAYHWGTGARGNMGLISYTLGKAAADSAGNEDLPQTKKIRLVQSGLEKKYPDGTPARNLADAVVEAFKKLLVGDSDAKTAAVKAVKDVAATECGKLTKQERVQFWMLGMYTADRLNWSWNMPKELKEYWANGICKNN